MQNIFIFLNEADCRSSNALWCVMPCSFSLPSMRWFNSPRNRFVYVELFSERDVVITTTARELLLGQSQKLLDVIAALVDTGNLFSSFDGLVFDWELITVTGQLSIFSFKVDVTLRVCIWLLIISSCIAIAISMFLLQNQSMRHQLLCMSWNFNAKQSLTIIFQF